MNDTQTRLAIARHDLAELGADAFIVRQDCNRRYLTGFTGSAGTVLVSATNAELLTDSRYYEQAEHEAPDYPLRKVTARYQDTLTEALEALSARRVAFEAEDTTVADLERWREAMPAVTWVPSTGLIERQRAVKTDAEIALIRRAAVLADAAMSHVESTIRPGMTEGDVAWSIERFLREHGAEALAFEPIVGAGENGALPHHHAGDRVIAAGEPIVVDLGARLDGYHSDLTRTFCIGPAHDPDYERVYNIVASAHDTALRGIRPGVSGLAADALARDVIKAAGYGDYFGHSLGHGVGLNIHEGPRLSFVGPETPLEAGNVVTVEPGIYLPGRFGVRIEDLVVVRADGVELLSTAAQQPVLAFA